MDSLHEQKAETTKTDWLLVFSQYVSDGSGVC